MDADSGRIYFKRRKIKVQKIPPEAGDLIIDLIPIDVLSLKNPTDIEIIKNPEKISVYEEISGTKVFYFSPYCKKELKERVLKIFGGLEGPTDKQWWYVEWKYGFLKHHDENSEEIIRKGIKIKNPI